METQSIQFTRDIAYAMRPAENPKAICLLLHGYLQKGSEILKLLSPFLPENWTLLAPNGVFPIAQGQGAQIRLQYTWYFFNPITNQYLITMDAACHYLRHFLLPHLQKGVPVKVIGYSQGGYLAPIAAQKLASVDQVIGINCRFRDEAIKDPLPFQLDAIHGLDDVLVDPKRAQFCHQAIMNKGSHGRFIGVRKAGHRISDPIGEALQKALI